MQSSSSTLSFIRNGKINWAISKRPIIISILGALIGVYAAINISNELFAVIFRYLLVVMLLVIVINPKRWLIEHTDLLMRHPAALPIFLFLGFYGGFIQMGMGIVFLMATVLILKYDLITANALKTLIVASYTVIVLMIFAYQGLIDWQVGLIIGIGQATGGYLTAEFASKNDKAQYWAYIVLVIMVISAILSTFGILDLKALID